MTKNAPLVLVWIGNNFCEEVIQRSPLCSYKFSTLKPTATVFRLKRDHKNLSSKNLDFSISKPLFVTFCHQISMITHMIANTV